MTYKIEIQTTGRLFTASGDDAIDAALNWAKNQTIQWWLDNGPDVIVIVDNQEYHLDFSYDLTCKECPE